MVLFRYSLEFCSRCFSLSRHVRFFHPSTSLLARGIRRSIEHSSIPSYTKLDQDLSNDSESNNDMSVQEQFARLELQRLEHESKKNTDQTSNSYIDDDNLKQEEFENDEAQQSRPYIDPSTTSIILFPGQGTQFVGMG